MKILNQVRELIIDAHNAGEQKGRKQVVEFVNQYALIQDEPDCHLDIGDIVICKGFWQAKLKEWGIE